MDLTLRSEYWDDREARAAFCVFTDEIFGLDFAEWDAGGFWDYAYTPFSLFDGKKVVSSLCVYLLDAVVDGREMKLAQISAVGTLPGWRRKGLNRRLTETGLEWARGKQEGIFLFATAVAIPFYEACRFEPIEEFVEVIEAKPVARRAGVRKLDPGRKCDLDTIYDRAKRRAPLSERFSVLNGKLVAWHAIYTLRNHIYEIPGLDCLVFFSRKDGCLEVFDVVGDSVPSWEEIHPYIADEKDRIVEFHFHTDKLRPGPVRTRPISGNHPFVKTPFPIEKPVFPFTSRA